MLAGRITPPGRALGEAEGSAHLARIDGWTARQPDTPAGSMSQPSIRPAPIRMSPGRRRSAPDTAADTGGVLSASGARHRQPASFGAARASVEAAPRRLRRAARQRDPQHGLPQPPAASHASSIAPISNLQTAMLIPTVMQAIDRLKARAAHLAQIAPDAQPAQPETLRPACRCDVSARPAPASPRAASAVGFCQYRSSQSSSCSFAQPLSTRRRSSSTRERQKNSAVRRR
jgi:hypothetical protein